MRGTSRKGRWAKEEAATGIKRLGGRGSGCKEGGNVGMVSGYSFGGRRHIKHRHSAVGGGESTGGFKRIRTKKKNIVRAQRVLRNLKKARETSSLRGIKTKETSRRVKKGGPRGDKLETDHEGDASRQMCHIMKKG